MKRLLPLRAQYAEDERKLVFSSEAQQLFDPMSVRVCPSCLNRLEQPPEIKDGRCSLCRAEVEEAEEPIDVEAERAAIRARLRAIARYIEEVERELAVDKALYGRISEEEATAQAQLDSDMSERLSPFVAQRDELVRRISAERAAIRDLERQLGWLDGVERRSGELGQLQSRIEQLREEQRDLEKNRPSRDVLISGLIVAL